MSAVYTDYTWVDDEFPSWVETGYGLAFVRDIGPEQLLNELGADTHRIITVGVEGDGSLAADWEHGITSAVGAAQVDDQWCVLAECHSGWVGVDHRKVAPIAAQHDWIYHGSNINAVSHFQWWAAGALKTRFEPGSGYFPDDRFDGYEPGALLDLVKEVGGIRLDEEEPRKNYRAACFALGERLTGVKVTAASLHSMNFLTAAVEH